MAQHDYVIDNASGATVRADINSALSAIQSLNSGTSAPSSTAAGMLWLDTTGGAPYALKIRDAGNNHWLTIASVTDPGADGNIETSATIKGTIDSTATGTLGNNIVFPAGHVIRTLTFETSTGVTSDTDQFIPLDSSNTSIQIPNYTKGNKLIFWVSVHYRIREGDQFIINLKSYYDQSSSTGAGTPSISSPWVENNSYLGFFDTIIATSQDTEDSTTLLDVLTVSGSGTTNIDYAVYADFVGSGTNDIVSQKRFVVVQEIQQ